MVESVKISVMCAFQQRSRVNRNGLMPFMQTGTTITDQMDLLREQVKMLAGEVALCTSSLKRLSEQAASNPENLQLKVMVLLAH